MDDVKERDYIDDQIRTCDDTYKLLRLALYTFFLSDFLKMFFFVGFHFILLLLLDRRVSRRIIVVQRLTLRFSVGLARNWKRWWSHNDVIDVVILTPQSLDPHRSDESIPASLEMEAWVSSTPAAST